MERSQDASIVEELLDRNPSALRRVIDEYGSVVYGVARRVLADPALAEEVAQDTFHALWRRPGAFDVERGTLRGYLITIARNKAVDLVRKHQSASRAKDALMAEMGTGEPGHRPSGVDAVNNQMVVREALETLTPMQREALVLAYFGGRTYREVATELGIPEGTAKTRLRDGLLALKKHMASQEIV